MPRSTATKPRTSNNTRSARARRSVSYTEPKDGSESSSSEDEPQEEDGAPTGEEEREQEEEDDSRPSKVERKGRSAKRPRRSVALGTRKSRAKNQLSLAGIIDQLPLDVLASIFGAGDLQSLFNLSRINKEIRAFLLKKSMIGVWKSCWDNSGLPESIEFTPQMNILKWCNILFGDCQVCGSKTVNADPYLRIKACAIPKGCLATLTAHHVKLTDEQYRLTELVASAPSKAGRNSRPTYLLSDFEEARLGLAYCTEIDNIDGEPNKTERFFTHSRFGSIPANETFEDTLKELLRKQHLEGEAIDQWFASQRNRQSDAKSQVRNQRIQEIKNRFIELGFQERHFDDKFLGHKQVRAARPLTEKTWAGVHEALLPILEENRRVLIEQDLAPIRHKRLMSLSVQYERLRQEPDSAKKAGLYPLSSWSIYESLESFKALYYPPDAEVGHSTFVDNGSILAQELNLKKEALAVDFFDILRTSIGATEHARRDVLGQEEPYLGEKWFTEDFTEEEKREALETCLAVFTCSRCRTIDTFPTILNHTCPSGPNGFASFYPPTYSSLHNVLRTLNELIYLTPCSDSVPPADQIEENQNDLPALQLPHDSLEVLGNGFSCTSCPPSLDGLARSWIGIIQHLLSDSHMYRSAAGSTVSNSVVYESPALAQLRLLKAHEDYHNDRRGIYKPDQ